MQTLVAFFLTIGAVAACSVAVLAALGYVSFSVHRNISYSVLPTPAHPELLFANCTALHRLPDMGGVSSRSE